eukprot:124568-Karenia_brevis.AAC.1
MAHAHTCMVALGVQCIGDPRSLTVELGVPDAGCRPRLELAQSRLEFSLCIHPSLIPLGPGFKGSHESIPDSRRQGHSGPDTGWLCVGMLRLQTVLHDNR